jgi:hypothetical protein
MLGAPSMLSKQALRFEFLCRNGDFVLRGACKGRNRCEARPGQAFFIGVLSDDDQNP